MIFMDLIVLSDQTFEDFIINSKFPVFVDLWAEWCKPCINAQPKLMELADIYKSRMIFTKVDVANNPKVEKKFDIMKIPRYIILDNKLNVIEDFVEAQPKKKYIEFIESAIAKL